MPALLMREHGRALVANGYAPTCDSWCDRWDECPSTLRPLLLEEPEVSASPHDVAQLILHCHESFTHLTGRDCVALVLHRDGEPDGQAVRSVLESYGLTGGPEMKGSDGRTVLLRRYDGPPLQRRDVQLSQAQADRILSLRHATGSSERWALRVSMPSDLLTLDGEWREGRSPLTVPRFELPQHDPDRLPALLADVEAAARKARRLPCGSGTQRLDIGPSGCTASPAEQVAWAAQVSATTPAKLSSSYGHSEPKADPRDVEITDLRQRLEALERRLANSS
jgi:hypothetical protein